jgi:hypothetical protein
MAAQIIKYQTDAAASDRAIVDWLRHEHGLEDVSLALTTASTLDPDSFVAAVRQAMPKKQKLSAAEISDLKREHAATVEPTRQVRAEIFALERKLSELVNAAYGLTPEEVALMWRTAPPRMPFTPTGLVDATGTEEADGEDE